MLKSLALNRSGMLSLESVPLARFPLLTSLSLAGSRRLTSISAIQHCPQLEALDLSSCEELEDISLLPHCCPLLKTLSVACCRELVDILPLSNCKRLQNVAFISSGVSAEAIRALKDVLPGVQ